MHVDRSRFLLLTASLAAAACNQPQRPATPDTGGADPARSSGDDTTVDANASGGGGSQVWLEIEPGTEDKPVAVDPNCNNQVGSPASCSLKPPAGHCESFDMTERLCRALPDIMQPRAAEAAVDCMLAANGTWRVCEWEFWNECIGAGMQAACIEPSTRPECDSISAQCGGSLDVFSCQSALSSVKPQHQERVASCVREFCEVSWCVSDIAMF